MDCRACDLYELVIRTWETTDRETKEATEFSIQKYVECGDFERDALQNWYAGLCSAPYLDEIRSIVEYLETAICAFLQLFDEHQYYRVLMD